MKDELYKHPCGLYVHDVNEWTEKHFKHNHLGKGDIIYNTCKKIIDDGDKSGWAHDALDVCFILLQLWGRRWPDEMNHPNDASNSVIYYLDKWRWKIWYKFNRPKPGHRLYRPQRSLTRDPYIYFFTASAMLDHREYIRYTSIPWYLYSRTTWLWHKYLKSGDVEDGEKYIQLEYRGKPPKKEFVRLLKRYRLKGFDIKTNQQLKN